MFIGEATVFTMSAHSDTPISGGPLEASDQRLLADLDRRYRAPLIRYFAKRIRENFDIDDLVQEVFLRLAKRAKLETVENIQAYVFQTAASVIRDRARRHVTHHHALHVPFDEMLAPSSEITAERVLLGKEAVARVTAALRELPERTRDVFILRALERRKYADVARALKISVRAAEKHMAKALAHVGRILDDLE